ncbi:MAG: NUDIX domain-containing protein [Nostocoides sp.]
MSEKPSTTTVFVTASVAVVDAGRLLVVRKRGTRMFMLVGGKLEPGESPLAAALREAEEEVGLALGPRDVEVLGHWRAPAANEPGAVVDSVVHVLERRVVAVPRAEIVELAWVPIDPGDVTAAAVTADRLAPLTVDHVLPALRGWLAARQRG